MRMPGRVKKNDHLMMLMMNGNPVPACIHKKSKIVFEAADSPKKRCTGDIHGFLWQEVRSLDFGDFRKSKIWGRREKISRMEICFTPFLADYRRMQDFTCGAARA